MMKLISRVWKCIKDAFHMFSQYVTDKRNRRLKLNREEYIKSVTEEAAEIFNFVEKDDLYYGTFDGVIITIKSDNLCLLDRISELRKVYVESKMKEYDNGKNS